MIKLPFKIFWMEVTSHPAGFLLLFFVAYFPIAKYIDDKTTPKEIVWVNTSVIKYRVYTLDKDYHPTKGYWILQDSETRKVIFDGSKVVE